MKYIKTKYIFGVIILVVLVVLYKFWYMDYKIAAYEDIPDLSTEYNVNTEMIQAEEKLNSDLKAATVYTRDSSKNFIAITFDGLPDPTTIDKILDLMDKYKIKASFFVEGSTAAIDKESILKLYDKNVTIGNYTYVGIQQLDKLPQETQLEQLIKTQKVISILTGKEPELFKAPDTSYVVPLLKVAAAANLKSAVKTDIFINKNVIKTDLDAINFINSVPQGSIISFKIGNVTNVVTYQEGNIDDTPATDKQPNLSLKENKNIEQSQDLVDVVERLFKAIQNKGIQTVEIKDLREIERVDILKPATNTENNTLNSNTEKTKNVAMLINNIFYKLDNILFNKAYAATNYEQLRRQNNHRLADSPRMIYTTDQAVCFAFAGLTKPNVVYATLAELKKMNAKGTFFVMINELRSNPKLIKDIINSGNEVAIGLRSLKDSNFYTTCKEIEEVQTRLAQMGAKTNLVMQPWGQITDETKEAVSAMNCKMISPTYNMVSSKHQYYNSAEDVMNEQFGRAVYSVGRGWIIYFRLDFYNNDDLVIDVMDLVKRYKIDNIAYNSFYDDAKINSQNDSAYKIKSIGDVLSNKNKIYNFKTDINYAQMNTNMSMKKSKLDFNNYIYQRYIGNKAVEDSNVFGFTVNEKNYMDIDGRIHTDKPIIFFTFDDWGTDAAINHLLYVLRKHNVKATFFILTSNVTNNPNLLRAIAEEGHDIASHSEYHKPMDDTNFDIAYSAYLEDYKIAYNKLNYITGDIQHSNGTSAFKPYFRAPTLTISKAGFKALYDTGYEYIVSGSYSTHDYEQPNLESMVSAIKQGIYDKNGNVINGAILVMHMSDQSIFTPIALDLLLTVNEQRADDDPAKFIVLPLSAYLDNGYNQSNSDKNQISKKNNINNNADILYNNTGYAY